MGVLRSLASQTAVYGLSSIVGRLVNFLLTPLFLHYYAPHEFGVMQDLFGLMYYPLIIITFGLETALFRWGEGNPGGAHQAYANAFVQVGAFAVGFGVLFGLGHVWVAGALGYAGRAELVLLAVLIIVLDTLAAIPQARLRQREKAGWFAFINMGNVGLLVLLNVLFLVVLGLRDLQWVFLANVLASAVRLGLSLTGNLPQTWRVQGPVARAMRNYGFYIMVAGLAGALNEVLGRNLLPRLWPAGQTWQGTPYTGLEMGGIFSAVYKLAMFIALATQAFRYAAEPFFFRNVAQKGSPRTFARVFHYYTLAMLGMMVAVGCFRHELAGLRVGSFWLIPPDYWVGLQAVPLILIANVLLGAYLNISIWFKLTKQVRYALVFTGLGAVITVVVNVLFIPRYGYMASAWASVLCYAAMLAACYAVGQRHYPVPYQWRRLLLYGAGAVSLMALSDWLTDGAPPHAVVSLTKGVLVASGFLSAWALERAFPLRW